MQRRSILSPSLPRIAQSVVYNHESYVNDEQQHPCLLVFSRPQPSPVIIGYRHNGHGHEPHKALQACHLGQLHLQALHEEAAGKVTGQAAVKVEVCVWVWDAWGGGNALCAQTSSSQGWIRP